MQEIITIPRTRQGVRNLDELQHPVLPISGGPALQPASPNVGSIERVISAIGGSGLTAFGLGRRSPIGLALAFIGAALMYRGIAGHCLMYDALGMSTNDGGTLTDDAEIVYRPD